MIKNYFNDLGNNYTLDEKPIGTWIDGSTIYRKICKGVFPTTPETSNKRSIYTANIQGNVNHLLSAKGYYNAINSSGAKSAFYFGYSQITSDLLSSWATGITINDGFVKLIVENSSSLTTKPAGQEYCMIIEYTKIE